MRMFTPVSFSRRMGAAAAVSMLSVALLCSCGEKEEEAPAEVAPAAVEEPAAAAEPAVEEPAGPTVQEAREAVYRQLWEHISPLVTDNAMVPEFNEPVKVYLETLNTYYAAMASEPPSVERVELGLRIAELTRNLSAYARAFEAFEHAMDDFEALPETERNTVEGMRMHSKLLNGMGLCLLSIGRAADAIPQYSKALEVDIAVLRALGVAEGVELPGGVPDPNVSHAVADVLGSYRCLGQSHALVGDMEEARDIYKKGLETMATLNQIDVNSDMGIAYVQLFGALGDLESRCGNEQEALRAWVQAANCCNAIVTQGRSAVMRLRAKRYINTLGPLIAEKSARMKAEAEARHAEDAAREAEEARKAAEEAAAAKAADEARAAEEAARAAEQERAAAAEQAEQPREERRKKRRRRNRH